MSILAEPTPPDVPVEFINIRVAVRAPVAGGDVAAQDRVHAATGAAVKGTRPAYFPERGGFTETTVYARERLAAGDQIAGPAVVEEEGSTLVIGPGAAARVAPSSNIIMTLARTIHD